MRPASARSPLRAVPALLMAALALGCGALRGGGAGEADEPASGDALLARVAEVGGGEARRPRRVVWVSIAGLPVEAPGAADELPLLASLAREGVFAERVEGVAPPSSYPAHATLVTGRSPRNHGIVADRLLGPRGVRPEHAWHVSRLRGPTLWQVALDRGLTVASLDWPTTLGAELADVLPDALPTQRGESWPDVLEGAASPWILERAREAPEEAARPGAERDAFLVAVACSLLTQRPPSLLLVRLSQAEAPLRADGPDSPAVGEALRGAEGELRELLACVDRAGRLEELAVVVTGDRPVANVHTEIRPNTALREARLVEVEQGRIEQWAAYARSNGGSAFVYARDSEAALAARRVLEDAADATGAFRVVSAQEMIRSGADPEAWFGLDARAGWHFADEAAGPLLAPARVRGGDGALPAAGEGGGAFVLWGAGVARGVRVPLLSQTDVAPTLGALLGTALEEVEGRALFGVLALPPVGAPAP